jgi:hypothetical protein
MSHFVATFAKSYHKRAIISHQVLARNELVRKLAYVTLRHFAQTQCQVYLASISQGVLNHIEFIWQIIFLSGHAALNPDAAAPRPALTGFERHGSSGRRSEWRNGGWHLPGAISWLAPFPGFPDPVCSLRNSRH